MTKRIITTILAVVMTLLALCIAAPGVAAEDEIKLLTIEDCVQISDTQIIVKFSEPIAVNYHGPNRGPWIALRVVDPQNLLQYDGNQALQYQGSCSFVGKEHDTILMEIGSEDTFTASDIINFSGDYAQHYKEGREVDFCIEEVPYDQSQAAHDGLLDNITTLDGETRLWANTPTGWDGMYVPIRVDFDYEIDLSVLEPLSVIDDYDYGTVLSMEEREIPEPIVEVVKQNNPIFMGSCLGASVILAVIIFFVIKTAGRKAGKKA